jgi:hypothetical protein
LMVDDSLAASTVVVLGDVLAEVASVLAAGSGIRSPGIAGAGGVVGLEATVVEGRCDEC